MKRILKIIDCAINSHDTDCLCSILKSWGQEKFFELLERVLTQNVVEPKELKIFTHCFNYWKIYKYLPYPFSETLLGAA